MKKIYFVAEFIKKNIRYFFAALAIILMFFISKSNPARIITTESCAGGACKAILDKPSLSKENPSYYVNDVMKSSQEGYYRLMFFTRANEDTKLEVIATSLSDNNRELKVLDLKKSYKNSPQEIVFVSDGNYSDILFKKWNDNDGADINISGVHVSKLEISNEKEVASLKPTIRGEINTDSVDQAQTDSSYVFDQLKKPGVILGQIFKPRADYIADVTLDIDIIKEDNNGGKKYGFELREAKFDGGVPEITSNILASVDFTAENIERYRQKDGKFKFPVFTKIDPEKYYFIGINSNNVKVDKFNYLRLKGTQQKEKYAGGMVAVKTKGKTYPATGNLYFITHQLNFKEYQGKRILGGAIIEDIGKSIESYIYKPMGNIYDLADLDESSGKIEYDDDKGVLVGMIESGSDSYMSYKFDTIFPANRVRIEGNQADAEWSKISILYSYDHINWKEIPDNIPEDSNKLTASTQYFDYSFNPSPSRSEIYVKIIPKEAQGKEKYGVSDFSVSADMLVK